MVRISVIIPVYNKGPFLRDCLDSLLNQSFKDIEIICIDDNSSDDSLKIIKEYKEKDGRIKLITNKNNEGPSKCRNNGISLSKGAYISFIDADDFVCPDFYEKLYDNSNEFEVIKGEIFDYNPLTNEVILNNSCNLNHYLLETKNPLYFYYGFTSAIYKKDFLDKFNLRFDENLTYNEDPLFSVKVGSFLTKFKVVDGAKYFYREVDESLGRKLTKEKGISFTNSILQMLSHLSSFNLSFDNRKIIASQMIKQAFHSFSMEIIDEKTFVSLSKSICSFLNSAGNGNKIKVTAVMPVLSSNFSYFNTLFHLVFQSLSDIEILCVSSLNLKELEEIDNRIHVINADSIDFSSCINKGISEANGEYIFFINSSDFIDLDYLEILFNKAEENNFDVIRGEPSDYYKDKIAIRRKNIALESQYFIDSFNTGLFKKEALKDITFKDDESLFLLDACKGNKVMQLQGLYYYYLKQANSEEKTYLPLNDVKSYIKKLNSLLNKIEQTNFDRSNEESYINFYVSSLIKAFEMAENSKETVGRGIVSSFIYHSFEKCKKKEEVLNILNSNSKFLYYSLTSLSKELFERVLLEDSLAPLLYKKALKESDEPITLLTFVNNKYVKNNPFITSSKIKLISLENFEKPCKTAIFNDFLNKYDFSKESWLIFASPSFELLDNLEEIVEKLDKNKLYGPVGVKTYIDNNKQGSLIKGRYLSKSESSIFASVYKDNFKNKSVNVLDSACLIVHSSLIKQYKLRFDEKIKGDLYVEDFCIDSLNKHNIESEVVYFLSCIHQENNNIDEDLKYLNKKYENQLYEGIDFKIGTRKCCSLSPKELNFLIIRDEIKKKK